MRVVIVSAERGAERVVGVRSLDRGRALFACAGVGERGLALALVEALAFCARAGHTVVTVVADAERVLTLPDGSSWVVPDRWLRGRSSGEIVAGMADVRARLRAGSAAPSVSGGA